MKKAVKVSVLSFLSFMMIFSEFASLSALAIESGDTSISVTEDTEIISEESETITVVDEVLESEDTIEPEVSPNENLESDNSDADEMIETEVNSELDDSVEAKDNIELSDPLETEEVSSSVTESIEEETVTTLKGEEIPISRIPEEYRDRLYEPKEGEEVYNPFLFEEKTSFYSYVTPSSTYEWPNNPNWSSKVRNFFDEHKVKVQRVAKAYNLYPSVMLAQAALESGWGTSSLSLKYNNYFGIKSTGYSGGSVDMVTWEWIVDPTHPDGGYAVTIVGGFRSYESSEESFRDYAQFLEGNPRRYRGAFRDIAATPFEAIGNIHTGEYYGVGGYATDPDYASKISYIIRNYQLEQLDNEPTLSYRTHVQELGDQAWVREGQTSGTSGQKLRVESMQINLENGVGSNIEYQTHVQGEGWMDWVSSGNRAGTVNQAKRLEAIKIRLTGLVSETYDVYYRVHAEKYGWLDWAKNGASAGTEGYGYRLEAIEVQLVPKGESYGLKTSKPYEKAPTFINYQAHVEKEGWQPWYHNGEMSGTINEAKRMEAVRINLSNKEYSGNILYRTHVESYGWKEWSGNGELSGTSGESKRLEAIEVKLDGELSKYYDVYYRVHSQSYGWLGWTKNGEPAGTEGLAKRIEAMEIKLVKKAGDVTISSSQAFIK